MKLNETMLKVLSRALSQINSDVHSIITVNEKFEVKEYELATMLQLEGDESEFGDTMPTVYGNKSHKHSVLLTTCVEDVEGVLSVIPKNVIAAFSISIPRDSVSIETPLVFDTMDAAHPYGELQNVSKWERSKTITISASYDAVNLGMHEAGLIMKHIRMCAEDPDFIHL